MKGNLHWQSIVMNYEKWNFFVFSFVRYNCLYTHTFLLNSSAQQQFTARFAAWGPSFSSCTCWSTITGSPIQQTAVESLQRVLVSTSNFTFLLFACFFYKKIWLVQDAEYKYFLIHQKAHTSMFYLLAVWVVIHSKLGVLSQTRDQSALKWQQLAHIWDVARCWDLGHLERWQWDRRTISTLSSQQGAQCGCSISETSPRSVKRRAAKQTEQGGKKCPWTVISL